MNTFGDDVDPWGSRAATNEWAEEATTTTQYPTNEQTTPATITTGLNAVSLSGDGDLFNSKTDILEQRVWGEAPPDPTPNTVVPIIEPNINQPQSGPTQGQSHEQSSELDQSELFGQWCDQIRKSYNPLGPDIITIEEIPEREGLLFKHTNYSVKHLVELPGQDSAKDNCVVRRYSDFLWLQETLLRRYPFRMVPELPPKKLGSQIADKIFLEKRRKGLLRFINLVMKHPVFQKDDLVLTFLTVPTELSNWRKQASFDTSDEFIDKRIAASFVKMWHKGISEQWNNAASSIERTMEIWSRICILVERHERKLKQMAHEQSIFGSLVNDLSNLTPNLYPIEQSDTVLDINNHFSIIKKHLNKTQDIAQDNATKTCNSLLPKFKLFTDILLSLRGLFERYKIMATNNIPQLQRHVVLNREKLEAMKGKPDANGVEYDRIKMSITRDKKSISEQLNRAWLVRKCILEEFTIFQETQFMLTRAFQDWSKLNASFVGINLNEWEKLEEQLEDMPLGQN